MKKLILEEWLSLDGFAVDKDGKLDFFPASETDKFSDRDQLEFLNTVDTILLGRKAYELFVDYWPTATTDHLQICPTMVGGGRRLFPSLPGYARLKRVNVRTYDTGAVFLHYEPQRQV